MNPTNADRVNGVDRMNFVRAMSVRDFHDSHMETIQRLADATERDGMDRYMRNRAFLGEVTEAIRRADAARRLELSLQRRAA